ncbi:MAG: hypothetical protein ABIJ39_00650 [Chloroflexota bacterium]
MMTSIAERDSRVALGAGCAKTATAFGPERDTMDVVHLICQAIGAQASVAAAAGGSILQEAMNQRTRP